MIIDFTEDLIDVRRLVARLTEVEDFDLSGQLDAGEELGLEHLREALDDIGTCAGDTLIRDDVFEIVIREQAYDLGAISRNGWLDQFVDWGRAAEAAKADYRAIRIEDESGDEFATYWIRS